MNETESREGRGAHFKYSECIVGRMSKPVCNVMQSTTSGDLEIGTEIEAIILTSETRDSVDGYRK